MAFTRRNPGEYPAGLDAIWNRAWTADAVADLASITAIGGSAGPKHGDIAFVTANSTYYLWMDNGTWKPLAVSLLPSVVQGDILYGSAADVISALAKSASASRYLSNQGGSNNPAWNQVDLSNGVTGVLPTANGGTSVNIASAALPLGSGQITFPATQNPSSDANTLDDYEEGTWTPTIGGTGGQSGQAYTTQVGRYVKVGRIVAIVFEVSLSAEGTITTDLLIGGLPFTAYNLASLNAAAPLRFANLITLWSSIVGVIATNTTQILVRGVQVPATTSETALTALDVGDTSLFASGMLYLADA